MKSSISGNIVNKTQCRKEDMILVEERDASKTCQALLKQ